jgi:hypothetical protein
VATTFSIHPAIGVARVGDSPDELYLAPEAAGGQPIACDAHGNAVIGTDGTEQPATQFRDAEGRIKRQGARFQVFVYDERSSEGRALEIGDPIQAIDGSGKLVNIHWFAYLANKKSSWYQFKELEGEHGYDPDHPLRNAAVTGDARAALIIDPGPQGVDMKRRRARFGRDTNPDYATTFPPPLTPTSIDTLGELLTDDRGRLVLLGGHGAAGSYESGLGQPQIQSFANSDGWFDDVSDGPVTAILEYHSDQDGVSRFVQVTDSAWALVGNPGYAPEIVNMITLDDVVHDLSVRELAFDTYLYGHRFDPPEVVAPSRIDAWRAEEKHFNPDYRPYFYRDIWPILLRPYEAQWTTDFLGISHGAHEIGKRGDFEEAKLAQPPSSSRDPYRAMRMFVYEALRQPGDENAFGDHTADWDDRIYGKPLMPLLCGDNPLTNTLTSKFLTLTPTMIFLLSQWAKGLFINERSEGIDAEALRRPHGPGADLDRGAIGNVLGGSFCPGGEIGWIARNPAIYSAPYRINANAAFLPNAASGRLAKPGQFFPPSLSFPGDSSGDPGEDLSAGLEPGDLTKRSALPWQVDFNECSTQPIDVTYEAWAVLYDSDGDPAVSAKRRRTNITLWWPTHRPMQVFRLAPGSALADGDLVQGDWALGIPQTPAGDLKMVSAWRKLGFLARNPNATPANGLPAYYEVEGLLAAPADDQSEG